MEGENREKLKKFQSEDENLVKILNHFIKSADNFLILEKAYSRMANTIYPNEYRDEIINCINETSAYNNEINLFNKNKIIEGQFKSLIYNEYKEQLDDIINNNIKKIILDKLNEILLEIIKTSREFITKGSRENNANYENIIKQYKELSTKKHNEDYSEIKKILEYIEQIKKDYKRILESKNFKNLLDNIFKLTKNYQIEFSLNIMEELLSKIKIFKKIDERLAFNNFSNEIFPGFHEKIENCLSYKFKEELLDQPRYIGQETEYLHADTEKSDVGYANEYYKRFIVTIKLKNVIYIFFDDISTTYKYIEDDGHEIKNCVEIFFVPKKVSGFKAGMAIAGKVALVAGGAILVGVGSVYVYGIAASYLASAPVVIAVKNVMTSIEVAAILKGMWIGVPVIIKYNQFPKPIPIEQLPTLMQGLGLKII